MLKILLVSHGDLCLGIRDTAKLFANDLSNIEAIPFYSESYDKDPEVELNNYLENVKEDDKVIIISDILWGSVNQKLMIKCPDKDNIHVVTGLNLPLLLELMTLTEKDATQEEISLRVNRCKESIVYMREYNVVHNDGDE